MLKKLSLILIIAVLAYSQVGYYFVMRHQQHEKKESIKEKIFVQLKDEVLDAISLPENQQKISWEEEGKEFSLNGEMYDVVKTKIINGKVVLFCINDKKERALIDNYNLLTKQNSSPDKKGKNTVDNSINLFVYSEEANVQHPQISCTQFSSFTSPLAINIADKVSPPPKA